MINALMSRLLAPTMMAAALGLAALAPGKANASDDLVRVLVQVADVIYHSGQPYYRHGHYGPHDRIVVVRDRYDRPSYYRYVPRNHHVVYRPAPRVIYHPAPQRHVVYRSAPRHYTPPRYGHAPRYSHVRDHRSDRRHDRRDDRRDRGHDRRDDRRNRGRWDR